MLYSAFCTCRYCDCTSCVFQLIKANKIINGLYRHFDRHKFKYSRVSIRATIGLRKFLLVKIYFND